MALAFPAAMHYYQQEDPKFSMDDPNVIQTFGRATQAIVQDFFFQQTFVENIDRFMDAVTGNTKYDEGISQNLGFTSSQMIPWSGMMRYITGFTDKIYRKASGFKEAIIKDLPYMGDQIEPIRDYEGNPVEREMTSYFMPWDIPRARMNMKNYISKEWSCCEQNNS